MFNAARLIVATNDKVAMGPVSQPAFRVNGPREALASRKKHREVLAALNLTPEQKEKVAAASLGND
jgi:hypothetical protein